MDTHLDWRNDTGQKQTINHIQFNINEDESDEDLNKDSL